MCYLILKINVFTLYLYYDIPIITEFGVNIHLTKCYNALLLLQYVYNMNTSTDICSDPWPG